MAPLLHLWQGPISAIIEPLLQLFTGSPIFFIAQSRLVGQYLAAEFAVGGAQYVATGRGLGVTRKPFHELYANFCSACIYSG